VTYSEYDERAQRNAPKTPAEVEQSARDLIRQGFSDHTIASILKIDVNAVRLMLGPRDAS
jgi:hypothetical protein